ncbi:hypothetical protein HanPSC8_Chr17g0789061 [Helianthus annuus]|nr:hypothetical protein HanPSC8_Chr17g0789061 [Helianthus annuus]
MFTEKIRITTITSPVTTITSPVTTSSPRSTLESLKLRPPGDMDVTALVIHCLLVDFVGRTRLTRFPRRGLGGKPKTRNYGV